MKTILATLLLSTTLSSSIAGADELMDIIHPESASIFNITYNENDTSTHHIFSFNDEDKTTGEVWSVEYEEYVNPIDMAGARPKKIVSAFVYDELQQEYTVNNL